MKIKSSIAVLGLIASSALATTRVSIDANNNLVIDGKTTFPISVAVIPPLGAKAPDGKPAWEELREGGVNYARVAPGDFWKMPSWNDAGLDMAAKWMDECAAAHVYTWMTLGEKLAYVKEDDQEAQEKLKKLVNRFKDHPALGGWKGADEPLWGNMLHGKKPASSIATTYKIVHELDPNHPVIVIQAARGTSAELEKYTPYLDITGIDIFTISYPMAHTPNSPNREISLVGDETKIIVAGSGGKPVWMALQIADSGTAKPGKTLRFPTFSQERFMTYEAIIDGARGVNYFGGALKQTLNSRDAKLGYNWTFWERVLKPVLAEINDKSPLHEALIAPNSKMPVKVEGSGIEFTVREVGDDVYILACKREGDTIQVKFSGLPTSVSTGDVMYEEPRKVTAKDGSFTDWFGPDEVHVYHFKR